MTPLIEINEDIEFGIETLEESAMVPGQPNISTKKYYIQGPMIQCDTPNRNKRKYPKHIVEKEVDRYRRDFINDNRALGELGHPQGPAINLDKASHKIISLVEDQNNYIGKALILDTPHGKIVKNFMDENVKLGVSSRGMGSVKNDGQWDIVQNDYFLATPADIVHDPSAYDAFVQALMESKEWVWNNGVIKEQTIDGYKKTIEKARFDEDAIMEAFSDFFQNLSR